jgi:hypothetical protein
VVDQVLGMRDEATQHQANVAASHMALEKPRRHHAHNRSCVFEKDEPSVVAVVVVADQDLGFAAADYVVACPVVRCCWSVLMQLPIVAASWHWTHSEHLVDHCCVVVVSGLERDVPNAMAAAVVDSLARSVVVADASVSVGMRRHSAVGCQLDAAACRLNRSLYWTWYHGQSGLAND